MDRLSPQFIVTVNAVLRFSVEASTPDAALTTRQSWLRRYHGRVPGARASTTIVDVKTATVGTDVAIAPLEHDAADS